MQGAAGIGESSAMIVAIMWLPMIGMGLHIIGVAPHMMMMLMRCRGGRQRQST